MESVLFGGKRVSFYLVEGVGLIEVIEEGTGEKPTSLAAPRASVGSEPLIS
jgi:hypothetical protein